MGILGYWHFFFSDFFHPVPPSCTYACWYSLESPDPNENCWTGYFA